MEEEAKKAAEEAAAAAAGEGEEGGGEGGKESVKKDGTKDGGENAPTFSGRADSKPVTVMPGAAPTTDAKGQGPGGAAKALRFNSDLN